MQVLTLTPGKRPNAGKKKRYVIETTRTLHLQPPTDKQGSQQPENLTYFDNASKVDQDSLRVALRIRKGSLTQYNHIACSQRPVHLKTV